MSTQYTFPMVIGAVSAVSSSAIQSGIGPYTPLLVPLLSAGIGAVFSYAVLKTTVQVVEKDVASMRRDLAQVYDLIRESHTRVARIEGRLEER